MPLTLNVKIRSFPHPTETFIVNHIVGLLKVGVGVNLYTNAYHGIDAYPNPENLKKYCIDDIVNKNIKVKTGFGKIFQILGLILNFKIFVFTFKYYLLKPQWSLSPIYNIYNYRHFDSSLVCHIQFNTSINPLMDLLKIGYLKPRKVIVTFHGYDAFRLTKDNFRKHYYKFYDECVYAVTVNSNYVKDYLISVGIKKSLINIVPMGIDTSLFRDLKKEHSVQKNIKLVSVGRLIQLKGHKYGIQVLKILLDKGYNVSYTIVGDGLDAYKIELIEEAQRLGCENHVAFLGQKGQNEVREILKQSSVFLMTSTSDDITGRREAFGIASVEAQACGLPVIAFDSGGVSEVLIHEDTGFLVKDRDVHAMAKKVELLFENKALYKKMSQNASNHALQNFDNERIINQYIDLYRIKA